MDKRLRQLGLALVFCWFAIGGLAHFLAADLFLSVVPPGLPLRMEAVYVSGMFELVGALGLLFVSWRRRAGFGLFLLTLAVTPANVYMWQHPELFPRIPESFLLIRLGLQVALLALILWSTEPRARQIFR